MQAPPLADADGGGDGAEGQAGDGGGQAASEDSAAPAVAAPVSGQTRKVTRPRMSPKKKAAKGPTGSPKAAKGPTRSPKAAKSKAKAKGTAKGKAKAAAKPAASAPRGEPVAAKPTPKAKGKAKAKAAAAAAEGDDGDLPFGIIFRKDLADGSVIRVMKKKDRSMGMGGPSYMPLSAHC